MNIDVEITSIEVRKCTDVKILQDLLMQCSKSARKIHARLVKSRRQKRDTVQQLENVRHNLGVAIAIVDHHDTWIADKVREALGMPEVDE